MDFTKFKKIEYINCADNSINYMVLDNLTNLKVLLIKNNIIPDVSSLDSSLLKYDFTYNNFSVKEQNRLNLLGYDMERIFPQNISIQHHENLIPVVCAVGTDYELSRTVTTILYNGQKEVRNVKWTYFPSKLQPGTYTAIGNVDNYYQVTQDVIITDLDATDLQQIMTIREMNPSLYELWQLDKDVTTWPGLEWNTTTKKLLGMEIMNFKIEQLPILRFSELTRFFSSYNKFKILNLNNCPKLQKISLYNEEQLEEIKFDNCILLQTFIYSSENNILGVLDFHHNINITDLILSNGNLRLINIDGLSKLKYLAATNNKLKQLNLESKSSLVTLLLTDNLLENLIVTSCTNLQHFCVDNNYLKTLSSFTKSGLLTFNCKNNNLPKEECDRIISLGYNTSVVNPQRT